MAYPKVGDIKVHIIKNKQTLKTDLLAVVTLLVHQLFSSNVTLY